MSTLLHGADVAKRYASTDGWELMGFRDVAIATYSLNLRCVIAERQQISTVDEFLLRAIAIGTEEPQDLAAVLGLAQPFVKSRVADLLSQDLIYHRKSAATGALSFDLTPKGEELTRTLSVATHREETISLIPYHGFLRRLWNVHSSQLLDHAEVRDREMAVIRPLPNRAPTAEELSPVDLSSWIKANIKKWKKLEIDVVSIRAVLKPARQKFLPAVLLQYRSETNSGNQCVRFAYEGKLCQEHTTAFEECDGLSRLPQLEFDSPPTCEDLIHDHIPEEFQREVRTTLAETSQREQTAVKTAANDSPDTSRSKTELKREIAELSQQREQDAVVVKSFEHPELLQSTIKIAKKELRIHSAFIGSGVVSSDPRRRHLFLGPLEKCLERGVSVTVVYGMAKDDDRRQWNSWQNAKRELDALSRKYPETFTVVDAGDHLKHGSHSKVLIKDDDYVVVGSFNWLSYDGGCKRDETSMKVSISSLVQQQIAEFDAKWLQPAH